MTVDPYTRKLEIIITYLKMVDKDLSELNIPCITVKGMAYYPFFKERYKRHSQDVDLWVKKEDFPRATAAFLRMGFNQIEGGGPGDAGRAVHLNRPPLTIDLHQDFGLLGSFPFDFNEVYPISTFYESFESIKYPPLHWSLILISYYFCYEFHDQKQKVLSDAPKLFNHESLDKEALLSLCLEKQLEPKLWALLNFCEIDWDFKASILQKYLSKIHKENAENISPKNLNVLNELFLGKGLFSGAKILFNNLKTRKKNQHGIRSMK